MLIDKTLFAKRIFQTVLIAGLCLFVFTLLPGTAHAQSSETINAKVVNIFVSDYLDPHNESLIRESLERSIDEGRNLYIIQLDSHGVAGADIEKLSEFLSESEITTAIWVGPASARFSNELKPLLDSVDVVGAANENLRNKSSASIVAPSIREFIAQLDGLTIERLNVTLDTGCSPDEINSASSGDNCYEIDAQEDDQFTLTTPIKFEKLSPIANLAHTLINPSFAVGILVLGLCLIAFEYFAASIGIASFAGISAVIAAIYGFGYLPTNWWAVALIVLAILAMVIDVQAGGVGFYTILGSLLLVVGSIFATQRLENYQVSFIAVGLVLIMALLFMMGAIPSLIRTRFGTPTIGREDFIGDSGIAEGDIDPEGSIKIRGASFKARTSQATPIKDGESCRVTKIEGIVLFVEPVS